MTTMTPETALDYALAYTGAGIRVIPITPGKKHPPIPSWQTAATVDHDQINTWWHQMPDHGIGLALGPQPDGRNLFAIDVDTHDHDGYSTLKQLVEQHGPLPATWTQETGGGGLHIILNAPADVTIRNQQSTGNRLGPGLDIRGAGGQIVACPSIHPTTGAKYTWKPGCEPWTIQPADAPEWLLDKLVEPVTPQHHDTTMTQRDDHMWTAFQHEWNWHHQLQQIGWTIARTGPTETLWTRPGKNPRDGHSAVLHEPDGPLVVFTTETPSTWITAANSTADGSGWALSAFGLYAAIYHHGNRSDAARQLDTIYNQHAAKLEDLLPPPDTFEQPTGHVDTYDQNLVDQLLDWRTFWETDHNTENWLVEPVIAEARAHAIYAPGGTGKSLFALTLALAACRDQKHVLYLDYEMTPADLADRLGEMGVDEENTELEYLHYALLPTLPACDTPEGGIAVNRLAELVDAQLVIIDTFSRAVAGDENEADTIRAFYRMTAQALKAAGRASVRLDHQGKDPDKGQRGSSAKNDDVDVVWALRRHDDGITLAAKKRRMGWVPETVKLVEHRDPLRFENSDRPLDPPGTNQAETWLDNANIEPDLGLNAMWREIRNMPNRPARSAAFAAQRRRHKRSETVEHLVDTQKRNYISSRVSNGMGPSQHADGMEQQKTARPQKPLKNKDIENGMGNGMAWDGPSRSPHPPYRGDGDRGLPTEHPDNNEEEWWP